MTHSENSDSHAHHVRIDWDGEWWTVSDEGGEFAKATHADQALRYVADLMDGPGTSAFPRVDALAELVQRVHGKTERLR